MVAMSSSIDLGHMHLIGKLIVVKLKLPDKIFFPTCLIISLAALLNLDYTSASKS
jgi:hypothetical protein